MTGNAKFCPRCNRTYPPSYGSVTCATDGCVLQQLGSILNSTIAGKFTLLEEIGSGGWGTVYLARHRELGSRVAVKILSVELCANMRHIDRFRQESQTLARLEHPGVVRVIDCGMTPRPFIVMEYVQGRLLSDLIAESGRLPELVVYFIARRLAETLNYAHSLGVIHRDLKPQNIMIADFDLEQPEQLDLKLLDFGVAKLIDEQAIVEGTGESFGSPQYMSPEQFSGEFEVGPKADIYSAACVLFECLCGRKPYNARSYIEWSSVHRHVRASFKENESLGKTGKELGQLILLCLSKNPDERPGTEEILIALKKIPLEKPAPKAENRLPAFFKSKPKLLAGILAGLLIVIAAGTVAMMSAGDKSKATKKLLELEDTTKTDLITTMSAGQTIRAVKTESTQLKLEGGLPAVDLQVYKPESAQSIIIVLSAAKGDSKVLEPLFNYWAERGFIVAVAQQNRKQSSKARSTAIINAALKELGKNEALSAGTAARFALVSVSMDLDQTLASARDFGDKKDESLPDLAGVILIDPSLEFKSETNPKDFHDGQFPVFYVLDAGLDGKTRPAVARRCQTAFTFGAGRQIFFNSSRVSLTATPVYRDQKVLEGLMAGFLYANLNHDRAKESYLYSQKSVLAVNSVAELRFR